MEWTQAGPAELLAGWEHRNEGCHRCCEESVGLMRTREGPVQWFEANHMESAPRRGDCKNDQGDWVTANELGGGGGEGKWAWRHR